MAAKPAPALRPPSPEEVDEFVSVRSKCRSWKPDVNPHAARYAELSAKILAYASSKPDDQPVTIEGHTHVVPVAARENHSELRDGAIASLQRKLGGKWLIENATVTLAKVRKAVTDAKEQKKFILTERTGPREIGEPAEKSA